MNKFEDNINDKGFLDVGNGHSIYWEDWGNPKAKPIFSLHGGPGTGFGDSHKTLFDPKKHRVIFHDQRGSKRSTPFAEIKNNTTQDLIADIERLRTKLGIEKMYIFGGSWGSTLSLLYTIAHPENVEKIVIWSVFLARQFEVDFVNEGYPKYFFPAAWERFISLVPEDHRKTGDSVMRYYAQNIHSSDQETATKFANEWSLWESTLVSINYDPAFIEKEVLEDKNNTAVAKLETHYFLNKCFVPENYIFDNISKIKHIPGVLVQGRFDMCTPPVSAHDFSKAFGDRLSLLWVNSGHLRSDPEMHAALRGVAATFLV